MDVIIFLDGFDILGNGFTHAVLSLSCHIFTGHKDQSFTLYSLQSEFWVSVTFSLWIVTAAVSFGAIWNLQSLWSPSGCNHPEIFFKLLGDRNLCFLCKIQWMFQTWKVRFTESDLFVNLTYSKSEKFHRTICVTENTSCRVKRSTVESVL